MHTGFDGCEHVGQSKIVDHAFRKLRRFLDLKNQLLRTMLILLMVLLPNLVKAQSPENNCRFWNENTPVEKFIRDWSQGKNQERLGCIVGLHDKLANDRKFMLSLGVIERFRESDDFFYSSDYIYWKRRFFVDLANILEETSDRAKYSAYQLYFYSTIEPLERIPLQSDWETISPIIYPESLVRSTACFVKSDLASKPGKEILKADEFKKCIKSD